MAEPSEQTPPVDTDTPRSMDPAHDDDVKSKKVSLADLSAKGTALYAHKHYEEAAEVFSRASILQAEMNGEIAPENAEILFHYGRSLFRVGQSKSDVLGGSAPAATTNKKKATKSKPNGAQAKPAQTAEEKVTQEGVAIIAEEKGGGSNTGEAKNEAEGKDKAPSAANKPFFQFTGDENFDDSDDDEEVNGGSFSSPLPYIWGLGNLADAASRARMMRRRKRMTMISPRLSRFLILPASAI